VTTGEVHSTFVKHNGEACTPKGIKLFASQVFVHVAAGESTAINKVTFSGLPLSSVGEGEFTGSGNVTQAGTFGLIE